MYIDGPDTDMSKYKEQTEWGSIVYRDGTIRKTVTLFFDDKEEALEYYVLYGLDKDYNSKGTMELSHRYSDSRIILSETFVPVKEYLIETGQIYDNKEEEE